MTAIRFFFAAMLAFDYRSIFIVETQLGAECNEIHRVTFTATPAVERGE